VGGITLGDEHIPKLRGFYGFCPIHPQYVGKKKLYFTNAAKLQGPGASKELKIQAVHVQVFYGNSGLHITYSDICQRVDYVSPLPFRIAPHLENVAQMFTEIKRAFTVCCISFCTSHFCHGWADMLL
jgi:hypothetical protein